MKHTAQDRRREDIRGQGDGDTARRYGKLRRRRVEQAEFEREVRRAAPEEADRPRATARGMRVGHEGARADDQPPRQPPRDVD